MRAGDIVLVPFPFSDLQTVKKRPALILLETQWPPKIQILSIAMITSKIDGIRLASDVLLKDWEAGHLIHPSMVRLAKMATIDADLVQEPLGSLSKRDFLAVKKSFGKLFVDWI